MRNPIYANGEHLHPCATCAKLGKREKKPSSTLGERGWRCGAHRYWKIYDPEQTHCGQWEAKTKEEEK